jgi:hypothetical protein
MEENPLKAAIGRTPGRFSLRIPFQALEQRLSPSGAIHSEQSAAEK